MNNLLTSKTCRNAVAGTPGKRRKLFVRALGGIFAGAALAGMNVSSASADHTSFTNPVELAYTACSWATTPGDVTVSVRPGYGFPGNTVAPDNNAVQSFDERIRDAVYGWDRWMETAKYNKSMVYDQSGDNADIILVRANPSAGDYLGYTYVKRTQDFAISTSFGGRCPHQTTPDYSLDKVVIEMAVRDTWFTQSNAYRTQWEACGGGAPPNWPYTCGKLYDFQALLAHELGHGIGLMHPQLISSSASSRAFCTTYTKRATMCEASAQSLEHRSEQRTIDTHDIDSLHYHHYVK